MLILYFLYEILVDLLFVSSGSSSTSSSFEFPARRSNVWFGVAFWSTWSASVFDGFSGVSWSLQQQSVLAQWSLLSELVQRDDFSTGFQNSLSGGFSDSKSGEFDFWHLVASGVVGDGSDANDGFAFLGVSRKSRERQRWSVLSGHKKSFEHDLVEFGVGSSGQESVELNEHVQVEIIALGGFSDGLSVLFVADVNSHVVVCF